MPAHGSLSAPAFPDTSEPPRHVAAATSLDTIMKVEPIAALCALAASLPLSALAAGTGHGLTARFEVEFMQMTIDHHFAAMRMTEPRRWVSSMHSELWLRPMRKPAVALAPRFGSTAAMLQTS